MRRIGTALLSVAITVIAAPCARADLAAIQCSIGRLEVLPQTVIEPCSKLLQNPTLSRERQAEVLFLRGRAYHRTGSIDQAAADYDQALKLAPDNEEIHLSRANVDFRRGRDDEAIARLHRAIAINPKNPRVLRSIGAVFSTAGQTDEALRFFSQALEIDPAEPYALLFRSQLYAEKRRYEEAIADADRLVKIPPQDINRIGYLDAAGRMRDFHIVALAHRAELLDDLGRHEQAERDLNTAVAHKAAPEALLARGEFLVSQSGREAAALADLNQAVKLEADNPRIHFNRGLALAKLRRFENAVKAFDSAIALQPLYAEAFRMRARAQRELGRTDAAVNDFLMALQQDTRLIRQLMPMLESGGYWHSPEVPSAITAELRQVIRTCMLDLKCN